MEVEEARHTLQGIRRMLWGIVENLGGLVSSLYFQHSRFYPVMVELSDIEFWIELLIENQLKMRRVCVVDTVFHLPLRRHLATLKACRCFPIWFR